MSSNRRMVASLTAPSHVLFALSLLGGFAGAGCGRDTLIGVEPVDPGPRTGSGGAIPIGSGGATSSGGVVGSGGSPGGGGAFGCTPVSGGATDSGDSTASCTAISTVPGQVNHCGHTAAAAYSPDGTMLATVTETASSQLHVWRLTDGHLLYEQTVTNNGSGAYGVTFSPDGKLIATAGNNPVTVTNGVMSQTETDTVVILDAATGTRVATLPTGESVYSTSVLFSADGTRLVTAGAANVIETWNVADWTRVQTIPYPQYTLYALHFSPDGQRLLASSAGTDTIFNVADGSTVAAISGLVFEMNEASYSPNGQLIFAIGGPGKLQILDANATPLQQMTFSTGATSPYIGHGMWIGNDHVVADDWSGTVEEWSKDPAQPQGPFTLTQTWCMPGQALGMAMAPDGRSFVVTGSFGFEVLTP